MIREVICYHLVYELQNLPEYGDKTFELPMSIIADSYEEAQELSERWLAGEGHKAYKYTEWVRCRGDSIEHILLDSNKDLEACSSTDAYRVKHGNWISTPYCDAFKMPIYQCSNCNKYVADYHISTHKYCLHCGARMDTVV